MLLLIVNEDILLCVLVALGRERVRVGDVFHSGSPLLIYIVIESDESRIY